MYIFTTYTVLCTVYSLSLLIIPGKVSAYLFIVVIKLHSTNLKLIQSNLLIGYRWEEQHHEYITASTI